MWTLWQKNKRNFSFCHNVYNCRLLLIFQNVSACGGKDWILICVCFHLFRFEKQVKEVLHKAFWDAFKEKVSEDPPDYSHAVVLITEVKEVKYRCKQFTIQTILFWNPHQHQTIFENIVGIGKMCKSIIFSY